MKLTRILPLLAFAALVCPRAFAGIQHVIAISADGLRGDFLQTFLDTAPADFPNLVRLRDASAFTCNARCDFAYSITIPNHLGMITGRPTLQPGGLPASAFTGYTSNFPPSTDTVHVYHPTSGTNSGSYKASIFDVAHDRGLSTALYTGKTRLRILRRSYNAAHGAPDVTGIDNGSNKVDFSQVRDGSGKALVETLVTHIAGTLEAFTFLHISDPDVAGHSFGWTTTIGGGYRNSIIALDGYIGAILNAIETNSALAGKVAIILTSDHGGGAGNVLYDHSNAGKLGNYTIPVFLSAPGVPGGSDLHALFKNRFNPGRARPTFLASAQPIRNTDVANLSALLLGLPLVPRSLAIPEFRKPLTITPNGSEMIVSWPLYLTRYRLESADHPSAAVWVPITSGIVKTATHKTYTFTPSPDAERFFRLRFIAH